MDFQPHDGTPNTNSSFDLSARRNCHATTLQRPWCACSLLPQKFNKFNSSIRTGGRAINLEAHLAPFAAAGIAGAGPQRALGDVDDDAADGAVVEVALGCMVLADRAWVVGVISHQPAQRAGVEGAPVALEQR